MAISFFGETWVPAADNSTTPLGSSTPHAITPPASMVAGQVVLVFVVARNNTDPAVSEAGGQTWTSHASNVNGTTIIGRLFSCIFNGTWSANPSFSTGSTTDGVCLYMGVFSGVDNVDVFDVDPTALDLASGTAKTLPGFNTSVNGSWAFFMWGEPDDNALSGQDAGWTGPDGGTGALSDHVGNQGGLDIGLFISKKTQTTLGATGNNVVALNTADVGAGYYFALRDASPTVALNTPSDAQSVSDTTPTLDFTGTDLGSDDVRFEVQISPTNIFEGVQDNANLTTTNGTIRGGVASSSETSQAQGQSITPSSSFCLGSIILNIRKAGSPGDGLSVSIHSSSETGPTLGTASTLLGSSITTSFVDYTFDFEPIFLSAGTTYYIVIERTDSTRDNVNYYDISCSNTVANPYANGVARRKDNTTWVTPNANLDQYFSVIAVPLLDKISGTDSGFANPDNGADTDPFTSGENIQFTVQSGDVLSAGVYYWRVRAIDPNGSNTYGAWSSTRSFTVVTDTSRFFRFFGP